MLQAASNSKTHSRIDMAARKRSLLSRSETGIKGRNQLKYGLSPDIAKSRFQKH